MHKSKKIKMRVYGRLEATPAALFPLDYFYYSVKLFSTFMITIDDLFDATHPPSQKPRICNGALEYKTSL